MIILNSKDLDSELNMSNDSFDLSIGKDEKNSPLAILDN